MQILHNPAPCPPPPPPNPHFHRYPIALHIFPSAASSSVVYSHIEVAAAASLPNLSQFAPDSSHCSCARAFLALFQLVVFMHRPLYLHWHFLLCGAEVEWRRKWRSGLLFEAGPATLLSKLRAAAAAWILSFSSSPPSFPPLPTPLPTRPTPHPLRPPPYFSTAVPYLLLVLSLALLSLCLHPLACHLCRKASFVIADFHEKTRLRWVT
jgi:hypothetical protein